MFDKRGAMDVVLDGVPCMHLLNLLERDVVSKFFGIHPENEENYLKRVPPKIYLRLDLPQDQLEEAWRLLVAANPFDRH